MNIAIIITLLFSLVLPGAAVGFWKKKTGAKVWPFLAGALCFFVFADILEGLLHVLVLGGTGKLSLSVMTDPLLFTLYTALAAGFFEETGRLFGFKVLLRKQRGKEISVAYGIGHGGMEVLLTLFAAYALYTVVMLGGSLGDPSADAAYLTGAVSITFPLALTAMAERISAMMLHIGLSILMFSAVRTEGKKYLYPVSILLHALCDVPAAMYQIGIITSIPAIECMIFLFGAAVLFYAVKKYYLPAEK